MSMEERDRKRLIEGVESGVNFDWLHFNEIFFTEHQMLLWTLEISKNAMIYLKQVIELRTFFSLEVFWFLFEIKS